MFLSTALINCLLSDIDECLAGDHVCDRVNGTCQDLTPSYYCDCKPGYQWADPYNNNNTDCIGKYFVQKYFAT